MVGETRSGGAAASAGRDGRSLLYVVKQLELTIRARLDEIMKPAGITAVQYTALTVLDHHDGLSLARLARDSFVTPQAAADLVAILQRRELVRRDRNPVDRREVVVSLTARGRELLAAHAAQVQRLEQLMVEPLDHDEARMFRGLLDRCRGSLSTESPPAPAAQARGGRHRTATTETAERAIPQTRRGTGGA